MGVRHDGFVHGPLQRKPALACSITTCFEALRDHVDVTSGRPLFEQSNVRAVVLAHVSLNSTCNTQADTDAVIDHGGHQTSRNALVFLGHGVAEQDGTGRETPVHTDGHDKDTPEGENPPTRGHGEANSGDSHRRYLCCGGNGGGSPKALHKLKEVEEPDAMATPAGSDARKC
ncbi:hypothetical protein KCV07_g115, partial [Aureobasidium melanogenum]